MTFKGTPRHRTWCAVTMACLAAAPAAALAREAVTPERVQQAIVVTEDPLERETTFSTEPAVRSTRGLLRTSYNDGHLRAAVHKGTGEVRFEVRQTFNYVGTFRNYGRVNYETSDLPQTARLRLIDANKEACQGWDSGMACLEEVSFDLAEAELRRIAESSGGDDPQAWELKFKPELGKDHRAQVPRAEIVGLLRAVDAYRASRGFSTAQVPATEVALQAPLPR